MEDKIKDILKKHKLWLISREEGERADLSSADLRSADLSYAKGINTAAGYLSLFDKDDKGILVYKAIGNTPYVKAKHWKIEVGSILTETVNSCKVDDCGCGVNFATKEWLRNECENAEAWWLCRIHWIDLADVVVPYNTDGKARCAKLELIEEIKRK